MESGNKDPVRAAYRKIRRGGSIRHAVIFCGRSAIAPFLRQIVQLQFDVVDEARSPGNKRSGTRRLVHYRIAIPN
ncbi:MAG: hypothetical protein KDA85_05805, partial [Planctomycetaceae bacterium]|nr:hypothetical protein [Planctomycetaceae bacterium]